MSRLPKLKYDRGTLLLHPPPKGKVWMEFATWDDRVEKFRIPACQYRPLVENLRAAGIEFVDEAKAFFRWNCLLTQNENLFCIKPKL